MKIFRKGMMLVFSFCVSRATHVSLFLSFRMWLVNIALHLQQQTARKFELMEGGSTSPLQGVIIYIPGNGTERKEDLD